jgi:hypothetical protein
VLAIGIFGVSFWSDRIVVQRDKAAISVEKPISNQGIDGSETVPRRHDLKLPCAMGVRFVVTKLLAERHDVYRIKLAARGE